jgi:hypothetical protein
MLDLSTLDASTPAEEGSPVEIEHPVTGAPILNDDGKPWTIYVRGEDSPSVRDMLKRQHNKFTERLRKRGQLGDADSAEQERVEKMQAATIRWENAPDLDSEPFPYSNANARKLYSDPRFPWVAEQVQSAMTDRKRFFSKGLKP